MKIARRLLWLAIRKMGIPQETSEIIKKIYAKTEAHLKTGKVYLQALDQWKD
jgi:hypothetical protein